MQRRHGDVYGAGEGGGGRGDRGRGEGGGGAGADLLEGEGRGEGGVKGGGTSGPRVGLGDVGGHLGPVPVLQVAVVLLRDVPRVHCTKYLDKWSCDQIDIR